MAIPTSDRSATTAIPINTWVGPYGVQSLTACCTGGKAVASQVTDLQIVRTNQVLTVTLTTQPPGTNNQGAGYSAISLSQSILLHNT